MRQQRTRQNIPEATSGRWAALRALLGLLGLVRRQRRVQRAERVKRGRLSNPTALR